MVIVIYEKLVIAEFGENIVVIIVGTIIDAVFCIIAFKYYTSFLSI